MENNYNITTKLAGGEVYESGIAYIVLPSDVDRTKYIAECFRTAHVSIFSETNGFINRVPIDIFSLNFITFPQEINQFGSAVAFNVDPVSKRYFISSIYFKDDEIINLKENQFRFKRELNGNFVEMAGSSDGAFLGFNVKTNKGGNVSINVNSDDDSGELNVTIDGNINLTALGETKIKQYKKLTIVTVDKGDENSFSSFEQDINGHTVNDTENTINTITANINAKEQLNVNTNKIKINSGDEPWILGNKFKNFMDDLIEEISKATVTTAIGQMPLLNAEQILTYKDKTKELLSQIAFIDK